jgi:hypothetical protein
MRIYGVRAEDRDGCVAAWGDDLIDTGELVLRSTAWLSLLGWAASEWERVRSAMGSAAERSARLLFTFGGLFLVVHSIAAFHVRYGWSQQAALRDTAQQTLAVTAMAVGAGLFVNYAFVLVWLGEIFWWWRFPEGYRGRARALDLAARGLFFFMFANGAFVFVRGPLRWIGAAALLAVVAAWYRGAGARAEDG